MSINKNKLDQTQLDYLKVAEKLQAELIENGFMASRIELREDSRIDFQVIFFDGEHDYVIKRDYNNNIQLHRKEWPRYKNISSYIQGETRKKIFVSNNVKVITPKKLQTLLDEEKAYHKELERLEKEAEEKIKDFLDSLKDFTVSYHREDYKDPKSDIKSGEIISNGIQFSFEIGQDGYISKKLSLHYAIDNTLENFIKLSQNCYGVENEKNELGNNTTFGLLGYYVKENGIEKTRKTVYGDSISDEIVAMTSWIDSRQARQQIREKLNQQNND